ncbi:hypothetical protein MmTuc01_1751 [Methanosarcina mazei Tuc01]|uniref:Uncharacterized protein n=1 Tax=Methanosarcina mazei Tuc01 TaxID=1236903 RepID=M1QJF0_METMZ|nr:hypothetical protein MmTuc01_1751 [Methanosarcina mazei Tuc01]
MLRGKIFKEGFSRKDFRGKIFKEGFSRKDFRGRILGEGFCVTNEPISPVFPAFHSI